MRRTLSAPVPTLAILALMASASVTRGQVLYTVTDLGTLPGAADSSGAALNDLGQVAGTSGGRAFRYTPGVGMVDLGTLPGDTNSSATAINNLGQVAGISGSHPGSHPFRYTNGVGMVDLGLVPGFTTAGATGINDAGQVSGSASVETGVGVTFRYTDGVGLVNLGPGPFGGGSRGVAINSSGQLAGSYGGPSPTGFHVYPYRYTDGLGMVALPEGSLASDRWFPNAINASGQVAGTLSPSSLADRAFLFTDGVGMVEVGILSGFVGSRAWGINGLGQVVGTLFPAHPNAFEALFYSDATGAEDLNALIDPGAGWVLSEALDINNLGQITGYGLHDGLTRAFLLTPTPVPEPSALMLVGAACVALAVRRKLFCAVRQGSMLSF